MRKGQFSTRRVEQLAPWSVPVLLVVIWQVLAGYGWVSTRVMPEPADVVRALVRVTRTGELVRHLGVSFGRAILGFAIGGSLGLALGVLNGTFPTWP